MTQHDQNIANADGATVRADINDALAALFSNSSGATAPSTTVAYQWWFDTTTGTIKRRNAANSGWIVVATLDESFLLSRSSNTKLDISDIGKTIVATSSFTQTFDPAATLGDGWFVHYVNNGTGLITHDPDSSETINGSTTMILYPGQSCTIRSNGSALFASNSGPPGELLLSSQTASGSASLDFTSSIGTGFERYRLDLINIKPATDDVGLSLRVGNSGGVKSGASDYAYGLTMRSVASGTPVESVSTGTSGIVLATGGTGLSPGNASNENVDGHIFFTNPEDNTSLQKIWWDLVFTNANGNSSKASGYGAYTGGTSGAIVMDRIQLLFNSGNIASGSAKLYGIRSA